MLFFFLASFSFAVLVIFFQLVLFGLAALILLLWVLLRIGVVGVVIWRWILRLIRIGFAVSTHRSCVHYYPAAIQVRFDPSVSWPTDDELTVFNLAPFETQDHACGDFELPQHQGERRVELFAVTFVTLQQKCFERIGTRQTGVRLLVSELRPLKSSEQSLCDLHLIRDRSLFVFDRLSCKFPQVI